MYSLIGVYFLMGSLKIAIGCDHGGFHLEEKILEYLDVNKFEYKDFGIYTLEQSDYPIVAKQVANEVAAGNFDRGILVCGTGLGMSIAANKVKGIRAVCLENTYSARVSRAHNNANVLCLGERVIGQNLALDIVDVWLKTGLEGGRLKRRIDMIE